MATPVRPMKHLLGWLIAGTRGGITRGHILIVLKDMPQNANQLATTLNVDYHTVRHHLKLLHENGIINSAGEKYGITYMLSPLMEAHYAIFEEIWQKIGKKDKKRKPR